MAADGADDLYGLPLEQFVPERDALAKRLRADKRRAEADEIKALRKPSVAAWAVNQTVRSQPKAARALWDAGDALVRAQEDLLAGRGDAATLRAAVERERAAVDALVDAARGLLTGEGRDLGEGTIERARETLHAAAIEPDARDEIAAGRAVRERAHAGLGAFGAVSPEAPSSAASRPAAGGGPAPEGASKRADVPRGQAARGRGARPAARTGRRKDAEAERTTRRGREADARRAAAAAHEAERAETAQRERERREAARARADAERELRDTRRVLEKAERAATRAGERLAEAQAAADAADAALDEARACERAAAEAL